MNEDVRMRWFRSPTGRELLELTGGVEPPRPASSASSQEKELGERENQVLRLLVQGRSNREIGEELHIEEAAVSSMLTALYARIGTSSRAETTAFAIRAA